MKPIKDILNFAFINLDKPTGPTSFWTSQKVKELFNLKKTSHLGTLDPQVTGVLPIALNRACKLNDIFMHRDKTYVGIMRLHEEVPETKLKEVITGFIGKINQLPPVKSRVKRQLREREVKTFKILEINKKDVLFETQVQAGTYIRKLCHDIGEQLGVGANMLELRRTQAGLFTEKDLITLDELEAATSELKKGNEEPLRKILIPAEEALKELLQEVQIKSDNLKQLLTGKPLMKSDITGNLPEETFAGFIKDKFIAIYEPTNEKDIIAKPLFVYN